MRVEEFLDLLEGAKPNGHGHRARCPAHDDHEPSLAVSAGDDGRIRVKCHAGCPTEEIVQALGLCMEDLFDDGLAAQARTPAVPAAKPKLGPIAPEVVVQLHQQLSDEQRAYLARERMIFAEVTDHYQVGVDKRGGASRVTIPILDEDGAVRDIRRWLPPERRANGSSKILHWEEGRGAPRLFPQDQLAHQELVLCEGELDALALVSHGVAAITVTGGVSTWPNELSELFYGKVVTILLDNDDAGRAGTEKRAESLTRNNATAKVPKWPEDRPDKWDATDELKQHGPESLHQILDAAEPWLPSTDGKASTSPGSEWAEPGPLPAKLPPVEPFCPELLPEAFRPWVEDVAERMQCPPDFPAVAAMIALAAVVGRKICIRPKQRDDWVVVPNLWGFVVGRPGVMKTPAVQEPIEALDRLEARAREEYEAHLQQHEASQVIAEVRQKISREEIRKALKNGLDPAEAARDAAVEEDEPVRRRYVVNDTTVEKLGETLKGNPRGVLLFRDELTGFLKSLDKEGREGDRAFYNEAWNGMGHFTYDRIGRGTVEVEAACVSIMGGIQPGPLGQYLRRVARGGADDDGLLQRFQLGVWPDLSAKWVNCDRQPHLQARQQAYAAFDRLDTIDPVALGANVELEEIPYLHFTPEAQELFSEWRTELEHRIRSGEESGLLEAHLAKYRSLVPSLALLIHLADDGKGPVGDVALRRACAWGDYLESHARRIYAPALAPAAAAAHALAGRLRKGDLESGFTLRQVYQKGWTNLVSREEAQEAADLLEDLGWLRSVSERKAAGGRPTVSYELNPRGMEGA